MQDQNSSTPTPIATKVVDVVAPPEPVRPAPTALPTTAPAPAASTAPKPAPAAKTAAPQPKPHHSHVPAGAIITAIFMFGALAMVALIAYWSEV